MSHAVRFSLVTLVALAALAAPVAARAAPASTSFTIVGYEYAFTSTEGLFAGTGGGNAGDTGLWNTDVLHDPLGSTPTYVDGGSFAMTTDSPGGGLDFVSGTFAHHGGTISTLQPGTSCTNQRYLVTGALQDVLTSTTSGGAGSFSVTLTHYRYSLFGHCVIYKARVVGTVSFSY